MADFFGELSPFEVIVSIVALGTGGYTFYKSAIERASIAAHLGSGFGIVESGGTRPHKIHLYSSFVNHGTKVGAVDLLEVEITTRSKKTVTLEWHRFFHYASDGQTLVPESNPHVFSVAPHDTFPRFVEFTVPDAKPLPLEPGKSTLELRGWVNKRDRAAGPNMRRKVHFELNNFEVGGLISERKTSAVGAVTPVKSVEFVEWGSD